MPSYDYECKACGYRFEAFQQMSDAPFSRCPECGKLEVRRLIGGGLGVIFKGSGFYTTDNPKSGGNGSKSSVSKDKSTSSAPTDNGKGKSEGKDSSSTTGPKKEPVGT